MFVMRNKYVLTENTVFHHCFASADCPTTFLACKCSTVKPKLVSDYHPMVNTRPVIKTHGVLVVDSGLPYAPDHTHSCITSDQR